MRAVGKEIQRHRDPEQKDPAGLIQQQRLPAEAHPDRQRARSKAAVEAEAACANWKNGSSQVKGAFGNLMADPGEESVHDPGRFREVTLKPRRCKQGGQPGDSRSDQKCVSKIGSRDHRRAAMLCESPEGSKLRSLC